MFVHIMCDIRAHNHDIRAHNHSDCVHEYHQSYVRAYHVWLHNHTCTNITHDMHTITHEMHEHISHIPCVIFVHITHDMHEHDAWYAWNAIYAWHIPFHVNRFHKSTLPIVQYKCLKSCSEHFILKNLILRTRLCGTAFITQHGWLLHFRQAEICLVEIICTTVVPASKGHLGGASP